MAGIAGIRSNVWMIDAMEYYLTNDLQATTDELQYMKQVCGLKSKPRENSTKRTGFRKPSIIIDDFLYHGDIDHAQNLTLIKELDIRHIINLSDSFLNKEVLEHCNVLSINISDAIGSDIRQHFDQTNRFLETCKQKQEKVLVHCQMGISRSSSIVLAYLLRYHHTTLHEAYDHLVQCRRLASPNLGFFLQLIRYEKDLNNLSSTDLRRIPLQAKTVSSEPLTIVNETNQNKNESFLEN